MFLRITRNIWIKKSNFLCDLHLFEAVRHRKLGYGYVFSLFLNVPSSISCYVCSNRSVQLFIPRYSPSFVKQFNVLHSARWGPLYSFGSKGTPRNLFKNQWELTGSCKNIQEPLGIDTKVSTLLCQYHKILFPFQVSSFCLNPTDPSDIVNIDILLLFSFLEKNKMK